MNRTKLDIEETKDVIIEAAIELFAQQGYSATNLKDIARKAGVSRTPLYYHFENKYLLYKQAAEVYLSRMTQRFSLIFEEECGFFQRLKKDLFLCTEMNISEENFFSEAGTNPELAEVFGLRKRAFDQVYRLKAKNIRRAIREGEIRPDTDVEDLVHHIYVLHFGFLGMYQCRYHHFEKEELERLLDSMVAELKRTFGAERRE